MEHESWYPLDQSYSDSSVKIPKSNHQKSPLSAWDNLGDIEIHATNGTNLG